MPESNIEIRSEEIQEVMGKVPPLILRLGISFFLIIFIIFILGCWIIKYPVIISSPITITGENPPANIIARKSGKFSAIFIRDNQYVTKNTVLGIIQNPASYGYVYDVYYKLISIKGLFENSDTSYFKVKFNKNYILGDLQDSYSDFIKAFDDYRNLTRLNFYEKKIQSLTLQMNKYNTTCKILRNKQILQEKSFIWDQKQFERDSILYIRNITSIADFEKSKQTVIHNNQNLEDLKIEIVNIEIQISVLEQNILDLKQQNLKQKLEISFSESFNKLYSQIVNWEQTFILKSPIDGKVSFTRFWSENQNVAQNDIVFTIVPQKKTKIIGKIRLSIAGSGKVKIGQRVNIKLIGFPSNEFGVITGKVKTISLVPTENNYYVEVELPNGLKTAYKKEIPFSQELQGTAEIVTADLRLLQRLFYPIKDIFLNH